MCNLEGKLKRVLWKLTQVKFLGLSESNLHCILAQNND